MRLPNDNLARIPHGVVRRRWSSERGASLYVEEAIHFTWVMWHDSFDGLVRPQLRKFLWSTPKFRIENSITYSESDFDPLSMSSKRLLWSIKDTRKDNLKAELKWPFQRHWKWIKVNFLARDDFRFEILVWIKMTFMICFLGIDQNHYFLKFLFSNFTPYSELLR